ncbi:MAG: cyclase family protein [Gammaproteobacteria bacterium]|nr:cyclase family protein [Gammaproteobacteria bacterium]
MQQARLELDGRTVCVDLGRPHELALRLDPRGAHPRHFGAPPARAEPLHIGEFSGAVARGASCNCQVLTLIPHSHGTHTECVGHLTIEPLDAYRTVPRGLLPAVVVSVRPAAADSCGEGTDPPPQAGDLLITRAALERAWPQDAWQQARAAVVRTLPNAPDKAYGAEAARPPPYLSREAAQWLSARGVEHLVVDVPSLDRCHDAGRLTAHRIFFGLPPGSTALAAAGRAAATVTELAFVPDAVADGRYLLELQVPALAGDAVPSRPLLYAVQDA